MKSGKWFLMALSMLLCLGLLSACGGGSGGEPTALPTIVLDEGGGVGAAQAENGGPTGGVTASGVVAPAQQADLASSLGGRVESVEVGVGQTVQSGEALIRLAGSEQMQAAVDAAALELASAQYELQLLNENADEALAAAQLRLANAAEALEDEKQQNASLEYRRASQATIDGLRADYIMAENELTDAQDFYNGIGAVGEDDPVRAQALSRLSAAQKARDRALANLNYAMALPDEGEVAVGDAELAAAQAEYDAAQRMVERLQDGVDPAELALAEARVKTAESQLAASRAALADAEIRAPFAGTVGRINVSAGDWAQPGVTLVVLADLAHLQVETTDLSERDVLKVEAGQEVSVFIKALGQNVPGRVVEISPLADVLGGDVVYRTVVELMEIPDGLRAGMSAEVEY